MSWDKELLQLEKQGLKRRLRWIESQQGARIIIDGREVINLCSNNYLGLANHPVLKEASAKAARDYGTSAGASRLITGSMQPHKELEERLAEFKKTEAALVFSCGYMANLGIITALVGRGDVIFCDRLNHASIIDACRLSGAELRRYPHKDVVALRRMLEDFNHSPFTIHHSQKLIVTDTVFSMDGDIAPLPELVEVAKEFDCMLMLDEAHATGVLGENGRGVVEYFGLEGKFPFIQMGTLGKALGGFGAYAAGSRELIDLLINKSRSFIYTTALPPAVVAVAKAALEVLEQEGEGLRQRLWENVEFFRSGLQGLGFDTMESQTQIIPVLIGDNNRTVELSQRLFDEGVFIQAIRPPSVPKGSARLRIGLMATHTREDLEEALRLLHHVPPTRWDNCPTA